ncbi:hypothetical protein TNCV_3862381 [Trichonephila clavipes]|uniref:Uncharacterized protein n=1 Tax=Trichonephila clavipes TaxID=2585209 RepID=A0A8X6V5U0_TRICX|nr:hypothetical protein TNCV_3862381 [Trichonephila clavipes]
MNYGHGSRVVKVSDLGWSCHESEPSTTEDPPCKGAKHVKSVESSYVLPLVWTVTAGSDVVQSGRPTFDDFFQHLWPYSGNNTANVVFQMVKRLWLIRIDQ